MFVPKGRKWKQLRSRSKPIPRGNIETIRKRVPRISTINKKIRSIQSKEELKYIDTLHNTSIPTSGTLQLLNGVALGDDNNEREGKEISLTSIQFRAQFYSVTGQLTTSVIRMLIFYDMQANGAAPTAATLLDNTVITSLWLAPYNREYQKRYKILYDKIIQLTPQVVLNTTAGDTTTVLAVEKYVRKKIRLGRTVKYIGDTAAITSIATNSLYLLLISDASSNTPTTLGGYRVYFKDD